MNEKLDMLHLVNMLNQKSGGLRACSLWTLIPWIQVPDKPLGSYIRLGKYLTSLCPTAPVKWKSW